MQHLSSAALAWICMILDDVDFTFDLGLGTTSSLSLSRIIFYVRMQCREWDTLTGLEANDLSEVKREEALPLKC